MRLRYLGYACQNLSIDCTTGRTFRLANLSTERAQSKLTLENDDKVYHLEDVLPLRDTFQEGASTSGGKAPPEPPAYASG